MEDKKSKILLCEDDTNLGMVLKNYLELNDYDVTLERDGRLGLAAFQREKFDICLLDVMMPNMDGPTLAREIRKLRPNLKMLFISGYAEEAFKKSLESMDSFVFLPKPFTLKQLAGKVKEVLTGEVEE